MLNDQANNLIDSHGRAHHYLRLSLTDQCNFRCRYCLPPEGQFGQRLPSAHANAAELIELVKLMHSQGIRKVRLTGGEPLLRHDAAAIVAGIKESCGLPVYLTTNGSLLQHHLGPLVDAGLDGINISIDSVDPQEFHRLTGRQAAKLVIRAIEDAVAAGLKTKLNAVVTADFSLDRAQVLLAFAAQNGTEIRFIEFMPLCGSAWQKEALGQSQALEPQLVELLGLTDLTQEEVAHTYWCESLGIRVGFISSMTQPFCASCNRLRLSCRGELHACLFSKAGVDLLGPLRAGASQEVLLAAIASCLQGKMAAHGRDQPINHAQPAWLTTSQVSGRIRQIGG